MTLVDRDVKLPTSEVSSWIEGDQKGMFLGMLITTAVVYDIVITMDNEVYYFWDKQLGLSKIVFFLNRYIGVVGAVMNFGDNIQNSSLAFCTAAAWLQNIPYTIISISIDYILTVRVLALYQNDKKVSAILYTLLIVEGIAMFALTIFGTWLETAVVVILDSHSTSCGYRKRDPAFSYILDWSLPLVYGALLLCLALFKSRQYWKLNGYNGSSLVTVLIRDQVLYFLLVISSSVINILTDKYAQNLTVRSILTLIGNPIFLSVLGSRMFFNLKEAAEHGVNIGTNWSSYSHSAICFDAPAASRQEAGPGYSTFVTSSEGCNAAAYE